MKLEIEIRDKVLIVIASGELSFSEALRLLKEICAATASQTNRALVDCLSVSGDLSTIDRYTLGVEIIAYMRQLQINPLIAIVGVPPAINGFGVLVGKNRGAKVEVFSERGSALRWLNQISDLPQGLSPTP